MVENGHFLIQNLKFDHLTFIKVNIEACCIQNLNFENSKFEIV